MNNRERFLGTMHFKPVDRPPLWSMGAWSATHVRWKNEGLSEGTSLQRYFGNCFHISEYVPVNFRFVPAFEERTVAEDEFTFTHINDEGVLLRDRKDNWELSMSQFIEFPVKDRKDFDNLRYRMNPNSPERFPANWDALCEHYKTRVYPTFAMGDRVGGFYGPLRGMMGVEALSVAFYDDPVLIEAMMDAKLELMLGIIERICKDTDFDYFIFWEDMAYNAGPLISPALFKKLMVPRYRQVTDLLRSHGVDIIMVDSDGNINELIPLWLEAGVNGVYPMESQSHMDVVETRKKYGKDLIMWGGLDKRVLLEGPKAIDRELERKLPVAFEGGYMPGIDHTVPPDVPFAHFEYYVKRAMEILERG